MPLCVYNTLTKKKEEFRPLAAGRVTMYVCGVTVYDDCHIGHARNAFVFEVMRRYFEYSGYRVTYVRNITDVDDKIIEKARLELVAHPGLGDVREATRHIAERYIKSYYEDMRRLGLPRADIEPLATGHIADIICLVETLIKKGYAYATPKGDVYFEVRRYKDYGVLSGQDLDKMYSGVRIAVEEEKKDPLDFALWKSSKADEPAWDSPWGKGRPGWHIECSAMSMRYLGETFDIHAGGRDLTFPHHENEIAQSVCATGAPFARYWIHNGLLTINGEKMSKSIGNLVSIREAVSVYSSEVLKMFFLGAVYSSPIDFSFEKLEEVAASRDRFAVFFDRADDLAATYGSKAPLTERFCREIADFEAQFRRAMDDDFNTPQALAVLFDMVNYANKEIQKMTGADEFSPAAAFAVDVREKITVLAKVLGVSFHGMRPGSDAQAATEEKIEDLIFRRNEARKNKDFKTADQVRDELSQLGVIIEDHKDGTRWRWKSR
ncbi:MAG: cysteine--tRNA ligase [Candidatus Omnitrophica bacterium]|nr:cysteine--tRNA ligase [Candidatus Omnitrophota bacterium]